MIYIFTATKSEAQAIVEHCKLKKNKNYTFSFFQSKTINLLVTGIGKELVQRSLENFFQTFQPTQQDRFINIGITAAPKEFAIGTLHKVQTILFENKAITLDENGITLRTLLLPQNTPLNTFADMEAFFIAQKLQNYSLEIYKVVSDHFDPSSVTKEKTKQLIKKALKEIPSLGRDIE